MADFTIRGITHNSTPVYGTVTLLTEFGDGELTRIVPITYVVADLPTPYNMIIGRPALNRIKAVASTYHQKVKFQIGDGRVGVMSGDQVKPRECKLLGCEMEDQMGEQPPSSKRQRSEKGKEVAVADQLPMGEDREVVTIEMAPGRVTNIGAHLGEPERARLAALLEEFTDIFAFSSSIC